MVEDFAQRIRYQGMSIDQYFKFTGMNYQKLLDNMKPQALKTIQTRLVLEAIVKAENIEVTDEELDKELTEMASIYKTEVDKLKEMLGDKGLENMKLDIAVQKAIDLVVAEAKEV